MNLSLFLLSFLSAFFITYLITQSLLLDPIRDRLITRWHSQDGELYVDGLTCPYCMGFWVSAALVAGLAQIRSIPLPALWSLAVAASVGTFSDLMERIRGH